VTTQPQQTFEKTAFHRLFPASLLLSLAALAAVAPLATDMYLPAFTAMAKDMGVGASTVQLTMTAFLVGTAIGQLGIGILSDRLGRRPLLVWGTILALAAGIAATAAPDIAVLLIARFFQGLGGASGMVLGRAVIADRARGVAAARALNLVMAIQGIAPVLAPIFGGALVGTIGWRGILGLVAGFTAVLLVLVLACVPETLSSDRRSSGGLRTLVDGCRSLGRDGFFVRMTLINGLVFALLMAYLSATPFVLQTVLGMGTGLYTVIFGCCAAMVTGATMASSALARSIPLDRQVRGALLASLAVDSVLAAVCFLGLRAPVDSPSMRYAVTGLLFLHVACLGFSIGNIPAMADKRPLRSKAPMTRGARSANPGMAGPQREWPSARHWTARYSRPSLSLRSWNVNPPAEAAVEAITITAAPHSFDTVGRTDGSREGAPPFCHE